jgi:hypothetical protein
MSYDVKNLNRDLALIAFIPGGAEVLKQRAQYGGNLAWYGLATGIQSSRNGLYAGVTFALASAVASARFRCMNWNGLAFGLGMSYIAGHNLKEYISIAKSGIICNLNEEKKLEKLIKQQLEEAEKLKKERDKSLLSKTQDLFNHFFSSIVKS